MQHQLDNRKFDCQQLQDSMTNKDQQTYGLARENQQLKHSMELMQ
jgi:hypothetical protein